MRKLKMVHEAVKKLINIFNQIPEEEKEELKGMVIKEKYNGRTITIIIEKDGLTGYIPVNNKNLIDFIKVLLKLHSETLTDTEIASYEGGDQFLYARKILLGY